MSNSSQSTRPAGRVLWKEFLEEVILHITPLCSLLHTLLKDKSMRLQDKCNIEIFLSPAVYDCTPITQCMRGV